jgi:hypothetical protein
MNAILTKQTLFILLSMVFLSFSACGNSHTTLTTQQSIFELSVPSPVNENQAKCLLMGGGYGYEYGDIVLLDTKSSPEVGDIVLYNWGTNKSNFHAFGPSFQLARVIALPGDSVIFSTWSYNVNGYNIKLREHNTPETSNVIWGTEIYEDVSGLSLLIPDGEYLNDGWIGREGRQEDFNKSDYFGYNRFTIKKEAIIGIIIKKIEHKDIPQVTW